MPLSRFSPPFIPALLVAPSLATVLQASIHRQKSIGKIVALLLGIVAAMPDYRRKSV